MSLFFDSAQAFGCALGGKRVASHGAAEVFSFHATKIVNSAEGCCITTDDDDLAARMRNIRSSYGAGPPVSVPITTNGRFSEAQAALGLLSLSRYNDHQGQNARLWDRYARWLSWIGESTSLPLPRSTSRTGNRSVASSMRNDSVFREMPFCASSRRSG